MDLATVVIAVAVLANGLLAGVFFVFACAVSPGFRSVDDASYLAAFRAINTAILNGWFLLVFAVAPLATVAASVLTLVDFSLARFALTAVAALCSVLTFGITGGVSVPLNRALDEPRATPRASGPPRGRDSSPAGTAAISRGPSPASYPSLSW